MVYCGFGVAVTCSRVEPKELGSSPPSYHFFSFLLSLFPPFFVLLYSINIYLNNFYLIKYNEQQEKYRDFREKVERRG